MQVFQIPSPHNARGVQIFWHGRDAYIYYETTPNMPREVGVLLLPSCFLLLHSDSSDEWLQRTNKHPRSPLRAAYIYGGDNTLLSMWPLSTSATK